MYESEQNKREYIVADDEDDNDKFVTVDDVMLSNRDKYFYYSVSLYFPTHERFARKKLEQPTPENLQWDKPRVTKKSVANKLR
jgi:hypothetical protein